MNINIQSLPEAFLKLSQDEIYNIIINAKKKLGDDLLILGHHYQSDQIIPFVDLKGDSLALARKASQNEKAKYIIFCGVHFMAESADMLTKENRKVILPDVIAGCTMAEMAKLNDVEQAWNNIVEIDADKKIIPITYINSAADLKAFCGKNNGAVCTSANAHHIIKWAFEQGDKLFFFPDQHLGRNSAHKLGIPLDKIITWDPNKPLGGNKKEDIQQASVILWHGYCYVHQAFTLQHIQKWRQQHPDIQIVVHPECPFEVVQESDLSGSTDFIIKTIENSKPGSKWAIGTEINLVNRIRRQYPDRMIECLSPAPDKCECETMSLITPQRLAYVLEKLLAGDIINQVKVPEDVAKWARISLEKMLAIN